MEATVSPFIAAIPVLLLLAAVEIIILRLRGQHYDWKDPMVSIVDTVIRQITLPALGGLVFVSIGSKLFPYRIFNLPLRTHNELQYFNIFGLFLGFEFLYYWLHRWSHEIRWFWASHAVHHSPNSMSLLTAERLGWTQNLSAASLTLLPLVILGYQPEDVAYALTLNILYQYWLHTEIIPKLGWFELIFNTPSHHRVHHGANARYLDANFGGVLIIFDRLFGTAILESDEEPVRYGLVKPLLSYNPVKVGLHEWINLARDCAQNWRNPWHLLGYLFGPPGYSHDGSRQTSRELRAAYWQSKGVSIPLPDGIPSESSKES